MRAALALIAVLALAVPAKAQEWPQRPATIVVDRGGELITLSIRPVYDEQAERQTAGYAKLRGIDMMYFL